MSSNELVQKLTKKKVKDYSLTIGFFIIFSFFVFFAIRPNLVTAFNLQRELQELRAKDKEYEDTIQHIVDYQTILETNRDNFFLLDQAVPHSPRVSKIVDDIQNSASASGVLASNMEIHEVSLINKSKDNRLQSYSITFETTSDIDNLKKFIDEFTKQRRLKTVQSLRIVRVTTQEGENQLFRVQLLIDGYYI